MLKLSFLMTLLLPITSYASGMCGRAIEAPEVTVWDTLVGYSNSVIHSFVYIGPLLLVIFFVLWFMKKRSNLLLLVLACMFLLYFHWSYHGGYGGGDGSTCTYPKADFQRMLAERNLPATTTVIDFLVHAEPYATTTPQ